MLLAALFGRLPYLAALAIWTGLGIVVFAVTVGKRIAPSRVVLTLLLSPATVFCLISGQSSLLTAAALTGIFGLMDRRPVMAGVLIGCLTIKPQLGLLFPVMLASAGRWRSLATAIMTALALAGLSAVLFGADTWLAFLRDGLPTQNRVLADPDGIATPFYPTVFMNLRGIGAPYGLAMAVQAVFALAAIAAVAWAFRVRHRIHPGMSTMLFMAASIAATPYLLVYDTLALSTSALTLLAADELDARGRLLAKLAFWLPLIQMALGEAHVPGPALIAPAILLYAVLRLRSPPVPRPVSIGSP